MADAADTTTLVDGATRAAVLLLSVGPDAAAQVLRHLSPLDVQRLSARMASVRALPRGLVLQVLREFRESGIDQAQVAFDTESFLQQTLDKALGVEAASALLARLHSALDFSGIETLSRLDAETLFECVRHEQPQVVATVMVLLEAQRAAALARLFPPEERNEILLRVALLEKVQPGALKELNEVMSRAVGVDEAALAQPAGGGAVPTAAILNFLTIGDSNEVLERIRDFDGDLAEHIVDQMFTFENLAELDDRSLQTLLLEIEQPQLVAALKGTSTSLREKFFRNMSKRAVEAICAELESTMVRVQDVETAQKGVLTTARAMHEEGRIVMERSGAGGGML